MLIAYFALRASLLSEPLFCLVCFFVSCLSLGILRPEVASDFLASYSVPTFSFLHIIWFILLIVFCYPTIFSPWQMCVWHLRMLLEASAFVDVELLNLLRNEDRQAEARCAVAVLQGHRG